MKWTQTLYPAPGARIVEICQTCEREHADPMAELCSNSFHLCRNCVRRDGVVIQRCALHEDGGMDSPP